MTVCGFTLVDGIALAWCDSDVSRDGAVVGSMTKMAVSGGVVGIGCGYADTLSKFLDMVKGGVSIPVLPERLRDMHLEKVQRAREYDFAYDPRSAYAIVSHERGAVFAEVNGFDPVDLDHWTSPNVTLRPKSADEVLEVAQLQLNFVRVEVRGARGGDLVIAKIGPDKTVTTSVSLII